jgi:hypothetical protein
MATEIKTIPTLKGKEAKKFIEKAEKMLSAKHTVDFTKEVEQASKILAKANIK